MSDIDNLTVFPTGDPQTPFLVKGCGSQWGLHRQRDDTFTITEFGRVGDLMGHKRFELKQNRWLVSTDNEEHEKLILGAP
jgi:hypothetical protein